MPVIPAFGRTAWLVLLFAIVGCTRVTVQEHLAAPSLTRQPERVIVANRLAGSGTQPLPNAFATEIVQAFERCNVAATVYRPNNMELDAASKLAALIRSFKPDAALEMRQTVSENGSGDNGTFLFTLSDSKAGKDMWKGSIRLQSAGTAIQKGEAGALFARTVVQTMAIDGVLKSCRPVPSAGT